MESTGRYSRQLTLWMTAQRPGLAPAIVNPEATAAYIRSLSLRNKTDRVEARALALFGKERQPQAYIEPSPEYAELRELARYREDVVRMRLAEEARMEEGSTSKMVLKQLANHIRHLKREEKRLEEAMQELMERSENLKKDAELLDTIDGVGMIVATAILSELGDLRRFKSGRQLAAFAGVTPRRFESGTSVHRRTRMCKKGSPRVRQMLYLAAMSAVKQDNDLQQCYLRLIAAGKEKMCALGAVMRKMLVLMRSMLISGKPYQRHHEKGGKTCEIPVDACEKQAQ
jgi:transposase